MRIVNKLLGRSEAPTPDVAACFVTDQATGRVVHHEVFESGHLAAERVADKLLGKVERLERKFPRPKFSVDHAIFGNRAALRALYPQIDDAPEPDTQ